MPTLPNSYFTLLSHFRSHFSKRIWKLALVLLIGAILAPNKRTVTACLRIVGLQREKRFLKYHRVLSRAVWSSLAESNAPAPTRQHLCRHGHARDRFGRHD